MIQEGVVGKVLFEPGLPGVQGFPGFELPARKGKALPGG